MEVQGPLCVTDIEQIRRARRLIDCAEVEKNDPDLRFILLVGALHVGRSVAEHWYTRADHISVVLKKDGKDAKVLADALREQFKAVFGKARRYALLTTLREWDYHWEPVINPLAVGSNSTYGRGAPMRLTTGPTPNSSVVLTAGNKLQTTGSGKRLGRKNYYQIQHQRFVDVKTSEAVPLRLALTEFLDDLPTCLVEIMDIDDVKAWIAQS